MPLKQIEYVTDNRVRINTGHRTFDQQCEYLGTGNVFGHVQYSRYIRPVSETSCNGLSFAPGHLFDSDVRTFRDLHSSLLAWLRGLNRSIILYEFRHFRRSQGIERKYVHGYVVTEPYPTHQLIRTIHVSGKTASRVILETVLPYIAIL